LPSTRSSFRARRSSQRGFALILALVLAILYFALIELLMIDASRELGEARRFRSRIIALTLAENGAELAAKQIVIVTETEADADEENAQGTMTGEMRKTPTATGVSQFTIVGEGESKGNEAIRAKVTLNGHIEGTQIKIVFAQHTQ